MNVEPHHAMTRELAEVAARYVKEGMSNNDAVFVLLSGAWSLGKHLGLSEMQLTNYMNRHADILRETHYSKQG